MERWVKQTEIYQGPVFSVWEGDAELEGGQTATRDVVRHQGSVAIVPILDSSIILLRQFRISVEKEILEIPAGRIEPGEDPSVAARRELEEETGYQTRRLVAGPSYYSSVGFLDERVHVFLAFDLVKTVARPEWDEVVRQVVLPFSEMERWLSSGALEDSKTIIGLREVLKVSQSAEPVLDNRQLYGWYADENHKYNAVIWQFPLVVMTLNVLAFDKVVSGWASLLAVWLINNVFLFTLAKHVDLQRRFTSALEKIAEAFRKQPGLHVADFRRSGWRRVFNRRATWVMVVTLVLFNQAYAVAALWKLLANTPLQPTGYAGG